MGQSLQRTGEDVVSLFSQLRETAHPWWELSSQTIYTSHPTNDQMTFLDGRASWELKWRGLAEEKVVVQSITGLFPDVGTS